MDQFWENFREGGFGMWPILLFGFLGIAGAARFAWRGEHRLTSFARWMAVTTATSSLLGFTVGMHAVFDYLQRHPPPEDRVEILFQGTKEASNCLTFGLILLTSTCLLLAIGYRRFPTPEGA